MKKTLVLLTLAAAVSAYSQGTVTFVTRDTINGVNANARYTNSGRFSIGGEIGPVANNAKPNPTISIASGGFNWGGVNARAGLYGGANTATESQLVLLVPAVGFQSAIPGAVDPGSDATRVVQGILGNEQASFQVRAWDTGSAGVDSYEAALAISANRNVYLGKTTILRNITLGNFTPPGGTPTPPAALTGLNGGTASTVAPYFMDYVGVPEPSIIGLGILGAVAGLLVFRRRN